MRVVFAGTPAFAATALSALIEAGIEVPLVLTQPDRPSGRGLAVTASPVKRLAQEHGIAVAQPLSLKRDAAALERLSGTPHDAMVVAAYGLILPPAVLAIPPRGCLNIHASLLPRWRGAAPIQRAIQAGDRETGVCIMQMDAGLDTGAVLLSRATPIADDDTAASLEDRLAHIGASLIVEALARLDRLAPVAQPEQGITYAAKIAKDEAPLDWSSDAHALARQVRAFDPFPGATLRFGDASIKVWAATAEPASAGAAPGTVIAAGTEGIVVACGTGRLRLTRLQRPGGKRLGVRDFLAGLPIPLGTRFA